MNRKGNKRIRHNDTSVMILLPKEIKDDFVELCKVSPCLSHHSHYTYSYLAKNVKLIDKQNLDENEEIKVIVKPIKEVIEMLNNNQFHQSLHATALFYALKEMGYLNIKENNK